MKSKGTPPKPQTANRSAQATATPARKSKGGEIEVASWEAAAERKPAKRTGAAATGPGKTKKAPAQAQSDRPTEEVAFYYNKISFSKVPAGKNYAVIDAEGRTVASFSAGQKTTMTTDCAQVKCPDSFGKDTVCWKCVERIKAK